MFDVYLSVHLITVPQMFIGIFHIFYEVTMLSATAQLQEYTDQNHSEIFLKQLLLHEMTINVMVILNSFFLTPLLLFLNNTA